MISAYNSKKGFTIVELLIVIVVIAILAAISIVAYNGIQTRARDSQRKSDIAAITKGLELYYIDKGEYPNYPDGSGGSTTMTANWSTTSDASWQGFINTLKPYMSTVPRDPTSTSTGGYNSLNYAYYGNNSSYCGAAVKQMYILTYKLESSAQVQTYNGACTTNPLGPYGEMSNYRVVK